jgi:tRNA dimethylallyltransferase
MLETGMWEEVLEMRRIYRKLGGAAGGVDLNMGIWQSIGFKEFLPCLEDGYGDEAREEEAKEKAVEEMKTATRQYARQQVRWVRIKFLNALRAWGTDDSIYLLDSSDVSHYSRSVTEPAIRIARAFLEGGEELPDPLTLGELARENLAAKREYDMGQRPDLWVQRRCEVCGVVTTNVPEWEKHVESSKHKKRITGRKKKLEVEEFLRRREEMRLRGGGEEVGEATMETKKE